MCSAANTGLAFATFGKQMGGYSQRPWPWQAMKLAAKALYGDWEKAGNKEDNEEY